MDWECVWWIGDVGPLTLFTNRGADKWWYLRSDFLDMKGRIHAVAVTQCTWEHKSGRTIPPGTLGVWGRRGAPC